MHQTRAQKAKAATRVLPEEDPEFQIAPMIDILLVLLVFFMTIATDQVMQVNQDVLLPVAKQAEPPDKKDNANEVYVNVLWGMMDNTGRLDVDNKGDMNLEQLTNYITQKRELAEKTNQGKFRVLIRADERVKYAYVRTVMLAIGAAKVPDVIFTAVDKPTAPKPSKP